jgi:hypothetical protein
MCTPSILSELNHQYLSKGSFPLMSTQTIHLWECLIASVENNCAGFVAGITTRSGYEGSFSPTIPFGRNEFDTGFAAPQMFLGYMNRYLCKDFGIAAKEPWQAFIQRLRNVMVKERFLAESDIHLIKSPYTEMGGGLNASEVSIIPDSALGKPFGSVPDQQVIANKAECWKVVKKRNYVSATGQLMAKSHYVLAHLLNHNLNGPGDNELNVVPFWAKANTDMSRQIEELVKALVLHGVTVTYTIVCGDPMKLDAGYKFWNESTQISGISEEEKEILQWELELPQDLKFSATATDGLGNTVNVVPPNTPIPNFVPRTVPVIR